jgi:hypothetical protein
MDDKRAAFALLDAFEKRRRGFGFASDDRHVRITSGYGARHLASQHAGAAGDHERAPGEIIHRFQFFKIHSDPTICFMMAKFKANFWLFHTANG